jgi:tripartite-type tricarboxylate transporter receptor subunit TctC
VKRLLITLALALSATAAAQSPQPYPNKPIRLIVPVPAGGLQDSLARALAHELGRTWGQSIVVDNRPGATGIIAADAVAKSPADGYVLFMTDNVTLMTNQFLRAKLPYDPVRDFAPVIGLVRAGNVLVTRPDSPIKSVADLIAAARAKPGTLNYGSFGPGSAAHIDTEALSAAAGIQLNHVPYKGGPAILTGVLAGELAFSLTGLPPALPLIRQGKITALAYGSLRRSPALPEVPTLAESGLPGFEAVAWFGWLAPGATPRSIIDKIAADVSKVLNTPEFVEKYVTGVGLEVLDSPPVQTAARLDADRETYRARLKSLNVKLD